MTERLEPDYFLPAVGQGALGLECRATDSQTRVLLQPLDCAESHQAVLAERSVLASFGGGCLIPMGAWARHFTHPAQNQRMLALDASVFDPDGRCESVPLVLVLVQNLLILVARLPRHYKLRGLRRSLHEPHRRGRFIGHKPIQGHHGAMNVLESRSRHF